MLMFGASRTGPHPRPLPQCWGRGERVVRKVFLPSPSIGGGAGGGGLKRRLLPWLRAMSLLVLCGCQFAAPARTIGFRVARRPDVVTPSPPPRRFAPAPFTPSPLQS